MMKTSNMFPVQHRLRVKVTVPVYLVIVSAISQSVPLDASIGVLSEFVGAGTDTETFLNILLVFPRSQISSQLI